MSIKEIQLYISAFIWPIVGYLFMIVGGPALEAIEPVDERLLFWSLSISIYVISFIGVHWFLSRTLLGKNRWLEICLSAIWAYGGLMLIGTLVSPV